MKRINIRKNLVLVLLIIFWIIMFVLNSNFRTSANMGSILREASATGIAALGMTLIIIMGDFDLSIGSMVAILGMILASSLEHFGLIPALLIVCVAGVIAGLINGVIVSYFNVPAFITTLGTYYSFRALAYIVNDANSIFCSDTAFLNIGYGSVAGIPIPFILYIILAAVGMILLNRTTRKKYSCSGKLAKGIPNQRYQHQVGEMRRIRHYWILYGDFHDYYYIPSDLCKSGRSKELSL